MMTLTRLTLTLAASLLIAGGARAALVGHWDMNEGSGGTAYDSTTNANDGTISGASWTAGKLGGGLDFSAGSDIVTVGHHSSLDITGALTLAAWVNYDSGTGYARIVEKSTGTGMQPYGMVVRSDGDVCVQIGSHFWTVDTNLSADQWCHVAGTYDGSQIKVYVNGGEVGSTTATGTLVSSIHNVHIGNADSLNRGLDGTLDDVRIYDAALSDAAVETLASMADGNYATAVKATNPGIYYRLREPAGRTAGDPVHNSGTEGATLDATWGVSGYSGTVPVSGVDGPWLSQDGLEADNTAAEFTGYTGSQSTDLINIGNPSFLDSEELTYSLLFKTSDTNNYIRMMTTDPAAGNNRFDLVINDGKLILVTGTHDGNPGTSITSPRGETSTTYNDGEWHHLVAVRSGDTASDLTLYVDGDAVSLSTGLGGWTQSWSARIGGYSTNANGYVGLMDEIAIWDRALTAGEAQGLYNALVPEPSSMLLLLLGALALVGTRRRR